MREIKLTIDGKEVPLTEEQLKALGIETAKNPFERVAKGDAYCFINMFGEVDGYTEQDDGEDDALFKRCNYFNDDSVAQQVALHQLLYRMLLKFAYDNECEDNQEWNKTYWHYYIDYNTEEGRFCADVTGTFKHRDVWFCSKKSAERAIKEVVEPFMKEHPDFVW